MSDTTDILIAGGGMVGSTLACLLAEEGFNVTLLEQNPPASEWDDNSFDVRVSALTRASQRLFQQIGAWDKMLAMRATAYQTMEVWDGKPFGSISFDAAEIGEPDLGWIIENGIIQRALWQRMAQLPRIRVLAPASVQTFLADEKCPYVTTDTGARMEPQLVVAAEGARSHLRDLAGITVEGWSYGQTALVATVVGENGHHQKAWQRFMPGGPLALLPTGKSHYSVVWSLPPEQAEQMLAEDASVISRAITQASQGCAGALKLVGRPAAFPLRLSHAQSYIAPGLALVGDSAHSIHPLAGQGVNLGLLDALCLREQLVEARERGTALGSKATLRRYERARVGDNLMVQFAMDGFKRLFSNNNTQLRILRNLGLGLTDRSGLLKKMLMRRALRV